MQLKQFQKWWRECTTGPECVLEVIFTKTNWRIWRKKNGGFSIVFGINLLVTFQNTFESTFSTSSWLSLLKWAVPTRYTLHPSGVSILVTVSGSSGLELLLSLSMFINSSSEMLVSWAKPWLADSSSGRGEWNLKKKHNKICVKSTDNEANLLSRYQAVGVSLEL